MVRIRYSAAARSDIFGLWRWYARAGGTSVADAIIDRIERRIDELRRFPELGPIRPDIASTARILVIHRWLILYDVHDGDVRIARILDSAQDVIRKNWMDPGLQP